MIRVYQMAVDIWNGIRTVFKVYPVPATFLLLWTVFLIWAVASY